MNESALVIHKLDLISVTKGEPCSVEFDFPKIWRYKKKIGKDFDPKSLYWVHVHPIGFGRDPSSVDLDCAAGLKAAFGELENFGIICFSNAGFLDVEGRISWYRFDDGRLVMTDNRNMELDYHIENEEFYMLKSLSYGDLWKSKT